MDGSHQQTEFNKYVEYFKFPHILLPTFGMYTEYLERRYLFCISLIYSGNALKFCSVRFCTVIRIFR
jgi:hypothetical protein